VESGKATTIAAAICRDRDGSWLLHRPGRRQANRPRPGQCPEAAGHPLEHGVPRRSIRVAILAERDRREHNAIGVEAEVDSRQASDRSQHQCRAAEQRQ